MAAFNAQPSAVTVVVEKDLVAGEDPAPSWRTSNGTGPWSGPPALAEPLIRADVVVLASIIITSDTPGPVVAEIRKGPLHRPLQHGGAGERHEIPVSADAVDSRQKSLAVRSDLNRRLFARYAPRVAAALVSGVGDALSDPGTSLVDLGCVTASPARPQRLSKISTRASRRSATISRASSSKLRPRAL
ncbi:hypothetical protein [Roseovarius spongiae]|uniref:hypothetical protein n=1 Tax=Roseovarius spongiae TaxID=2320272 RepID=UPI0011C458EC|nr:hypothetical protein [Roseovarius spongiae]